MQTAFRAIASSNISMARWCVSARSAIARGQAFIVSSSGLSDVSGERAQAVALASRALRYANDSMTLAILGHAFACAHELAVAEEVTDRALQIDGASAWA